MRCKVLLSQPAWASRAPVDGARPSEALVDRRAAVLQERLTLKHKNTSKWAKRALRRGINVMDETTKEAMQEQLRLGMQLRQKVCLRLRHASSRLANMMSPCARAHLICKAGTRARRQFCRLGSDRTNDLHCNSWGCPFSSTWYLHSNRCSRRRAASRTAKAAPQRLTTTLNSSPAAGAMATARRQLLTPLRVAQPGHRSKGGRMARAALQRWKCCKVRTASCYA